MRQSVYAGECSQCGKEFSSITAELVCTGCGQHIRIEWQWQGDVKQGGSK